jgi:hypothetical protein
MSCRTPTMLLRQPDYCAEISALTDSESRERTIEHKMETMRHAEGRPQAKRGHGLRIRSRERGRVNFKIHLSLCSPPLSLPPRDTIACSSARSDSGRKSAA